MGSVEPVHLGERGAAATGTLPGGGGVEPAGAPWRVEAGRIGASWLFHEGRVVLAGGLAAAEPPLDLPGDAPVLSLEDGGRAGTWRVREPRYLHGEAWTRADRVLLVGGLSAGPDGLAASAAVEELDLTSRGATEMPRLPFRTAEPLVASLPGGRVLVAGGYDDAITSEAAVLDPARGAWEPAPALPRPRAGCSRAVAVGPRHVLFAGGAEAFDGPSGGALPLLLDVYTCRWSIVDLPLARGAAVIGLGGGAVLACGGRDREGRPIDDVALWTLPDLAG